MKWGNDAVNVYSIRGIGMNRNKMESIIYKGYPGGCGVPNWQDSATNSPLSPYEHIIIFKLSYIY